MDNPHEILSTLEGTVERLKVIYEEKGGSPLNDDVVELRQLCISVEEVLRHQQKDKLSFWGERRDYWHYLSEGVGKVKNFETCLKQVQKLTQYTSSQGKGRALIRECLSQQLLADCIQNCLSNQKRTKEWYHPTAMVLVDSFVQRLLTALYDLSDVTFDLPQDGLELDETWPAFVLKSFRDQNGVGDSPSSGANHRSSLQKVLGGTTKVAKKADKQSQKVQVLEKAIEEQPSEVYIKREIPFDLDMVGSLLIDIRDCFKPATEHGQMLMDVGPPPLPELHVAKLDDITTGLSVLKNCVMSWTQEMTRKGLELHQDNKSLMARQMDLEMQVQETMRESDYSETDLVRQLQDCRDELRVLYSDHQRVNTENEELNMLMCRNNEKMKEMEDSNFNLEEQLARCEAETSGERQRAYSMLEIALQEKEENFDKLSVQLEQSDASNKQLQQSLEDTQSRLEQQSVVIEEHQKNAEDKHKIEETLQELKEQQKTFESEIANLKSQNLALVSDLEVQRRTLEQETSEKLELESKKWLSVERERDRLKAELGDAHSTVENEMSALKFKLSSINIDLQQAKEHSSKKDRTIAELRNQSRNLESQISEARERADAAEKELEEIKLELQDIEGVLANQQVEMTSMHEQLTEKSLSRDQERVAMLKEQTLWDSRYTRLELINAELKKDIDAVTSENDELKKQFKKLLEQKVTLWQHADDLEQDHIAMGTWVDSKTVTECMNCNTLFTMFARKHHCRACGKVLCGKCCINKIQLAVSKDPSRVCEVCLDRIQKKRIPFASDYINNQSILESAAESLLLSTRPRSNATLLAPDMAEDAQRTSPARLSSGRGSSGSGTPTHRGMSSNSLNIERTIALSGNSLQAKLIVQNHTPDMISNSSSPRQLGSSSNIELNYSSEEENDEFSSTVNSVRLQNNDQDATVDEFPSNGIPRVSNGVGRSPLLQAELQDCSFRSVSSMEYSVDPKLRMREAEKLRKQQETLATDGNANCDNFTLREVQGATIDEDYYLIEAGEIGSTLENKDSGNLANPREMLGSFDVGALASRLEKLNTSDSRQEGVNRPRSISTNNGNGVEHGEMKKVEIGEGGAHVVKIPIEKAGTAVAWEFRTEPKGIAFGISYKERADSTREEDVLPQKRCMSHKFTLNGDYCAQKKGIYILKFDNCHSKYTGRTLYYRVLSKVSN